METFPRKLDEQKDNPRQKGPKETPHTVPTWRDLLVPKNENNLKVLVISNDASDCSIITNAVRSCGAQVTAITDGDRAVDAMRGNYFDMIFAEISMPGMNGSEVVVTTKKLCPETEVFVITPHGKIDNAVECTKRGAEGLIVKPEMVDQIVIAVRKAKDRKQLRRLAYTDGLTSLFNHNTFQHFLLQECHRSMRKGNSFGLLILDVDDFKLYNDLNGHLLGDIALIKLGKLLKETTRASDIPARYGGDEFAVILTEITPAEALFRAGQIRQMISLARFQNEKNMPGKKLTVSIGLAVYPEHGMSHIELIRSADQALYQAKAEGRNRICVFKSKGDKVSSGPAGREENVRGTEEPAAGE